MPTMAAEEVDIAEVVGIDIEGRRTTEETLVLGSEVLIGQTGLEKFGSPRRLHKSTGNGQSRASRPADNQDQKFDRRTRRPQATVSFL